LGGTMKKAFLQAGDWAHVWYIKEKIGSHDCCFLPVLQA
jgi:hypothetical protein